MRRKEKEIQDINLIESLIEKAPVCRLGLSSNNMPYIVPLNFGYKDRCLYFHSAKEGRKISMIESNMNVCFEVDIEHELIEAEEACKWGMKYYSVIGFGKAFIVEDPEEKRKGLDVIMAHYSHSSHYEYPESQLQNMLIIKVQIDQMTGKQSGYKSANT